MFPTKLLLKIRTVPSQKRANLLTDVSLRAITP